MGLYDDQIKNRQNNDQKAFLDSMRYMAANVLGTESEASFADEQSAFLEAVDEVIRYFGCEEESSVEDLSDPREQLEAVLRPTGIAWRDIRLHGEWRKESQFPLIVRKKENGMPVALLPGHLPGYSEKKNGAAKTRVTKAMATSYEEDAIQFYRPLPQRSLRLMDIINYIKKSMSAGDVIVLILLSLLVVFTGMLIPVITLYLSGFVLQRGISMLLIGSAVFLICAGISSKMFELAEGRMVLRIQSKISPGLRAAMMNRVLNLPVPFFKNYSSGELANRVEAVDRISELIVNTVFSVGLTSVFSLLYIGEIASFVPSLVIPAVIIVILTVGVMIFTSVYQSRITKRMLVASAKENGISYALLSGIQKIRLAGAEKRVFAKWARAYSTTAAYSYNPPLFLKISPAIQSLISMGGLMMLYIAAVQNSVQQDEFIAFSSAYGMVIAAFTGLTDITNVVAEIRPLLSMLEPVFSACPETAGARENVRELSGAIELSNVSFRYNDRMPYVIENMNIRIRPGEYVAIVGRTGCGKSTLIRLLLGFEIPEKGSIYYDGVDMLKLDPRSLRRRIGTVTQNGGLFSGSIFENIAIASSNLTEKEAWEAAEVSGIADDIAAMPMGMHTIISEGQGGISGGQKQRLMIARAVATKPDILMFDEATSALDNRTQKKISNALDALKCTRIVIAHRLSTIENCDRILFMDKGRITEEGTFGELMERRGAFYDLVERQKI